MAELLSTEATQIHYFGALADPIHMYFPEYDEYHLYDCLPNYNYGNIKEQFTSKKVNSFFIV
jgi:hypothetical protein